MTAGVADLDVDARAGSSFAFIYCNPTSVPEVPGPPINVTGWHAQFTVRSSYGDGIAVELDDQALGGITVGTTNGRFAIAMTAEQTSMLPSQGVYDLKATPPASEPIRIVQGKITASPAVSP